MSELIRLKSISEVHEALGMVPPQHPLISVYNDDEGKNYEGREGDKIGSEMYLIMIKDKVSGSLGYGRNSYDFQEGTRVFVGPGQVMEVPSAEILAKSKGWSLLFHPDLVRKSHLGNIIDE